MKYPWIVLLLALTIVPAAHAANFINIPYTTLLNLPFNNASNTTQDESGLNQNVTNNASNYSATGSFFNDGFYKFNGSTNIIVNNSATLATNNSRTVSVWVNVNDSLSFRTIFEQGSANQFRSIVWNNDGVRYYIGGNLTSYTLTKFNQWVYLTLTYNGTHTTIYENGIAQAAPTATQLLPAVNNLFIGSGSTSNNYFNGSIDEFIIINQSLTAAQVQSLYLNYTACGMLYPNMTINYQVTTCAGEQIPRGNVTLLNNGGLTINLSNVIFENNSLLNTNNANSVITINNSNLTGSATNTNSRLYFLKNPNVTITNSVIRNFTSIVFESTTTNTGSTQINNSNFSNITGGIFFNTGNNNANITNSIFQDYNATSNTFIRLKTVQRFRFENNIIQNSSQAGIEIYTGSNNGVVNANFLNIIYSHGIINFDSNNTLITNNRVNNYGINDLGYGIDVYGGSNNITAINNTLTNGSNGLIFSLQTGTNSGRVYSANNTIEAITGNGYGLAFNTIESGDFSSENDRVTNAEERCFSSRYANNGRITNFTGTNCTIGILLEHSRNVTFNNLTLNSNTNNWYLTNFTNLTINNQASLYYTITSTNASVTDIISGANPITTAPSTRGSVLTSSFTQNVTGTFTVLYSAQVLSPTLYHASTGVTENITSYTYNSTTGAFTFNTSFTPGVNTLLVDSSSTPNTFTPVQACSAANSSISTFANWLTLLAIVLVVGIVLYVLYGVYSGSLVIDAGVIIKAGVGLIIAGIFIVIGVIIVAGAASTCV